MSSFNPDNAPSPRPIDNLRRITFARESQAQTLFLRPRRDRLWVDRLESGRYTLSVRRGEDVVVYTMNTSAVHQLAQQFDISPGLLRRLSTFPVRPDQKSEDTRLLNKCLWEAGGNTDFAIRAHLSGEEIDQIHSRQFTPVRLSTLVQSLSEAEDEGRVKLVHFDLQATSLRLVLQHVRAEPVSIPYPHQPEKPVLWYPGAVLMNQEDGGHSAIIAPALITAWGKRVIMIPHRKNAIVRRAHKGATPAGLAKIVLSDLLSTRDGTPYAEMARRFISLARQMIPAGEAQAALDASGVRIPTHAVREQILNKIGFRASSYFWLAAQMVAAAETLPPSSRFDFELAISRLVWTRGKAPK